VTPAKLEVAEAAHFYKIDFESDAPAWLDRTSEGTPNQCGNELTG